MDAPVVAAQIQQVPVAGNDEFRPRGDSARQDMIVVGVGRYHAGYVGGLDQSHKTPQVYDDAQWRQPGNFQPSGKLVAVQHIEQFREPYGAAVRLECLRPCAIE